jgi:methylthioribose-1-phosphate isomerase
MHVNKKHYNALWVDEKESSVKLVNQLKLPFKFEIETIKSYQELVDAIKDMRLRGAPLIGAAGAFALWLATREAQHVEQRAVFLKKACDNIISARPTAVNLQYATTLIYNIVCESKDENKWPLIALASAQEFYNDEIDCFKKIGLYGVELIQKIAEKKNGETINILTHCNAGWLACGDYGTATAPIYMAHEMGIKLHVWVDETRPRLQGVKLTAWEMHNEGIPFTVIADNTGGYLMQEGMVDMVIVGADRVALNGDVANKVGTYLKALAARDNNVPFYVAIPSSTIDFNLHEGVHHIPVEVRENSEIQVLDGIDESGKIKNLKIMPDEYPSANYAFDITPFRFVTGLITEKGIIGANKNDILKYFPKDERK